MRYCLKNNPDVWFELPDTLTKGDLKGEVIKFSDGWVAAPKEPIEDRLARLASEGRSLGYRSVDASLVYDNYDRAAEEIKQLRWDLGESNDLVKVWKENFYNMKKARDETSSNLDKVLKIRDRLEGDLRALQYKTTSIVKGLNDKVDELKTHKDCSESDELKNLRDIARKELEIRTDAVKKLAASKAENEQLEKRLQTVLEERDYINEAKNQALLKLGRVTDERDRLVVANLNRAQKNLEERRDEE
jgi:thioredoxin-like negative regulator of GroEL